METDRSSVLQRLIERIQAGDQSAIGELVVAAERRLRALAGKILNRSFLTIKKRGQCDTSELTQELSARLLRALKDVSPNDVKHLMRIATQHIKWHLLDLIKGKSPCPTGDWAAKSQDSSSSIFDTGSSRHREPASPTQAGIQAKLRRLLCELPELNDEVVDLKIVWGLTHQEIAEQLDVSTKMVQRRWDEAKVTLYDGLVEAFPGLEQPPVER